MQHYSLTEVHDRYGEVLERAAIEPVLLMEDSQPGYVIMSAQNYQQLIERLTALEDGALGQLAEAALQNSRMIGSEPFTVELQRLAELDNDRS